MSLWTFLSKCVLISQHIWLAEVIESYILFLLRLEDAQQHKDQVEKQKQTLEVQMKGQINQARVSHNATRLLIMSVPISPLHPLGKN